MVAVSVQPVAMKLCIRVHSLVSASSTPLQELRSASVLPVSMVTGVDMVRYQMLTKPR